MNQVDKERLAVSAAISLLLYAGLFVITAWLDILSPGEPREYFGQVTVEVHLLPEPEPVAIAPPEEELPEVAPVTEEPPVVELPEEETPAPEPQPPEPQLAPETVEPQILEQLPPATSPPSAEQPESTPAPEVTPAEAVPVKTPVEPPVETGTDDSVALPETTSGTEEFPVLRPDAPTDQFGEDRIEYGAADSADDTRDDSDAAVAEQPDSFLDLSRLDNLPDDGQDASDGTVPAGTGIGTASDDVVSDITVESLDELAAKRGISNKVEVDTRGLTLPNGLPSMVVQVEFMIERTGNVAPGTILINTGDADLDSRIMAALRNWKFVPISIDRRQKVRFKYEIKATQ